MKMLLPKNFSDFLLLPRLHELLVVIEWHGQQQTPETQSAELTIFGYVRRGWKANTGEIEKSNRLQYCAEAFGATIHYPLPNWIKTISTCSILRLAACVNGWNLNAKSISYFSERENNSPRKPRIILQTSYPFRIFCEFFISVFISTLKSAFIRSCYTRSNRDRHEISSSAKGNNKTITMNDITIHQNPSYGENMIKWALYSFFCPGFCRTRFMSLDFYPFFRREAFKLTPMDKTEQKRENP